MPVRTNDQNDICSECGAPPTTACRRPGPPLPGCGSSEVAVANLLRVSMLNPDQREALEALYDLRRFWTDNVTQQIGGSQHENPMWLRIATILSKHGMNEGPIGGQDGYFRPDAAYAPATRAMSDDRRQEAYGEGWRDAAEGQPAEANRYPEGSALALSWSLGWTHKQEEA